MIFLQYNIQRDTLAMSRRFRKKTVIINQHK
jgi:hypothetical protein